ncbi:MAG: hypothetical protein AB1921_08910 [Thermodesulfobacteriota bacterium]
MRHAVIIFALCGAICVYNFGDAVRDMAPGGRGGDAALSLVRFVKGFNGKTDDRTREFFGYLDKTLSSFSWDKLVKNPYTRPLGEGYDGVVLQGGKAGDQYFFRLSDTCYDNVSVISFGSFIAEMGLKKNGEAGSTPKYSGFFRAKAGTSVFSHRSLVNLAEGLLKVLDPENIKAMQTYKERNLRYIKNDSLQVVHEMYKAFPKSSEIFRKYIYIYGTQLLRDDSNEKPVTRVRVAMLMQMKELSRDYPAIADYLDSMRGLLTCRLKLLTPDGLCFTEVLLDTREDFLTLWTITREGYAIPWGKDGKPVFAKAFKPSELTDFSFTTQMDLAFDFYGLKLDIPGIRMACRYKDEKDKGTFTLHQENAPPSLVSGRLASVIPKWVVDLAIPKDFGSHVDEFVSTMYRANKGRGSMLTLTWNMKDPSQVAFSAAGESEFAENFLTRLAPAVFIHQMRLKDETKEEAGRFIANYMNGLEQDLIPYASEQYVQTCPD